MRWRGGDGVLGVAWRSRALARRCGGSGSLGLALACSGRWLRARRRWLRARRPAGCGISGVCSRRAGCCCSATRARRSMCVLRTHRRRWLRARRRVLGDACSVAPARGVLAAAARRRVLAACWLRAGCGLGFACTRCSCCGLCGACARRAGCVLAACWAARGVAALICVERGRYAFGGSIPPTDPPTQAVQHTSAARITPRTLPRSRESGVVCGRRHLCLAH